MRRRIADKRDRVRQLRVFCEVVRAGSISDAAERLGLTPPAVSIQVRELEHELDALLLDRGATGAVPTRPGERLHALAAPVVGGVDALFADFRHTLDAAGAEPVRLAVSSAGASFVLPPYVKRFHEHCPDTMVRLETVALREGLERLLAERVDLVLGVRDPHPPERFDYHELCTYGMVLVTALDHPLAGRASVTPSEVREYRSVIAPDELYSRQFGQDVARELGLDVNAAVVVGGWAVLKRYVEAGIGISVMPSLCIKETDRLSVIALDAWRPPRSYGVFVLRDRLPPRSARRFLEVLMPDAVPSPRQGPQVPRRDGEGAFANAAGSAGAACGT